MQAGLRLWRTPCSQNLNFLNRDAVLQYHRPTETILANLAAENDHVYYVNVQILMCGAEGSPLTLNGELIYADTNHLRRDLSLETRESLVSLLHLDKTLRLAIKGTPGGTHAGVPVSNN